MLEIKHVSKTFNPNTITEKKALRNISLKLDEGDFVTIIGGNGAGKLHEIEKLAKGTGAKRSAFQHDHRNAAIHMGADSSLEELLLHLIQSHLLQIIQTVQVFPVAADGVLLGGGIEADQGFEEIAPSALDQLTQTVEICGEFGIDWEEPFSVLAFGFAE